MTRSTTPARNVHSTRNAANGLNSLPTPSLDLPLTSGLTGDGLVGAVTFTGGGGWYPDDDGVYIEGVENTPSFNANGVFLHPSRINRCTNYNANPDVGLSNVAVTAGSITRQLDTAELADAGLKYICASGYVFEYANSTGSQQTITIAGAFTEAGANRSGALSIFSKVSGVAASMKLSVSGVGEVPLPLSNGFEYIKSEGFIGTDAADQMQIVVEDGCTIQWVLNQVENENELGCSVSFPIITAGATGSLNTTNCHFSGDNIPDKNFVLYLEFKSSSQYVMSNNSSIFRIQDSGLTTRYFFSAGRSSAALFRHNSLSSVDVNYNPYTMHDRHSAFAMRISLSRGGALFANGQRGHLVSNKKDAVSIAGGKVHLGSTQFTNSSQSICQIKNVRVYEGSISDTTLENATNIQDDLTDLGAYGAIFHDPNIDTRIWSLKYDAATSRFTTVVYSDDYGDSWTDWTALGTVTAQPDIVLDSNGNVYYFALSTQKFQRIDATTKVETEVINPSDAVSRPDWSWTQWQWGEDSSGNLYTSFYSLTGVDNQYVWISADGGVTWVSKSALINGTNRHVHSLHVDPNTDKAWASFGDDGATRGTAYSTDQFDTVSASIADTHPGPTGLTFTSEAVYTSTDSVGNTNYMQSISDDTNAVERFEFPKPFDLSPVYYARAIEGNPNEMWLGVRNEGAISSRYCCILKLTKNAGLTSQWGLKKVIVKDDEFMTRSSMHMLSSGLNGVIPDTPYIFTHRNQVSGLGVKSQPAVGAYRIARE